VLVLHGTADSFTDPRGSERFVAVVPAVDQRLERFADGRHELLNDLERDRARALILDWIDTRIG
jgi:alpha-beta hydrolase superfamily lysophospholipase